MELKLAGLLAAFSGFCPCVPWGFLAGFGFVDDRAEGVVDAWVDAALAVSLEPVEQVRCFSRRKRRDRADPEHCEVALHRRAYIHERSQRSAFLCQKLHLMPHAEERLVDFGHQPASRSENGRGMQLAASPCCRQPSVHRWEWRAGSPAAWQNPTILSVTQIVFTSSGQMCSG